MCYPCTQCGACGKYDSDLFMLSEVPILACPLCGADIDMAAGTCPECLFRLFSPPGVGRDGQNAPGLAQER